MNYGMFSVLLFTNVLIKMTVSYPDMHFVAL